MAIFWNYTLTVSECLVAQSLYHNNYSVCTVVNFIGRDTNFRRSKVFMIAPKKFHEFEFCGTNVSQIGKIYLLSRL